MSNSFLFAFAATAVLSAGAVDFVNQTKVTGGVSVEEYLAALPVRVGAKAPAPDGPAEAVVAAEPVAAGPAGQTVDKEVLRQQMALAAGQIAAASTALQAGQPANAEAAAGVATIMSAILKGISGATGQAAPDAGEPIRPGGSGAAIRPKGSLFGSCAGTGLGKRCKVGG